MRGVDVKGKKNITELVSTLSNVIQFPSIHSFQSHQVEEHESIPSLRMDPLHSWLRMRSTHTTLHPRGMHEANLCVAVGIRGYDRRAQRRHNTPPARYARSSCTVDVVSEYEDTDRRSVRGYEGRNAAKRKISASPKWICTKPMRFCFPVGVRVYGVCEDTTGKSSLQSRPPISHSTPPKVCMRE